MYLRYKWDSPSKEMGMHARGCNNINGSIIIVIRIRAFPKQTLIGPA